MISDKRLKANQRNAQWSTGPRTPEGKESSRRNSLKHGLTGAGVVTDEADGAEVEAKYERLAATIAPANEVEETLVERMALASVRMNRCERVDRARRRVRLERSRRVWEARRQRDNAEATHLLRTDPQQGHQRLCESSLGCAWLSERWRILGANLSSRGCWTEEDLALAGRLLGKKAGPPKRGDRAYLKLHLQFLALLPEFDCEYADKLLKVTPGSEDEATRIASYRELIPARQAAHAGILKLVETQRQWLAEQQELLEAEYDPADLATHEAIAEVDSSPGGIRLARYDAMNEQAFHRNWNALSKMRKQGPEALGLQGDEKPEPEPGAQNEPTDVRASFEGADTYDYSSEGAAAAEAAAESRGEPAESTGTPPIPHSDPASGPPSASPPPDRVG